MRDQEGDLGLSEFISALRQELADSIEAGRTASIQFTPGPIDLELQVHAERNAEAGGKIDFKVFGTGLGASVGGSRASGSYQTLKMRLEIAQKPGAPRTTIRAKGAKPKEG
ncbi:trypco2 family protein [Mesorhizobium mediterraneum]|uniref:trypco2 family protein n=1 Tax=Mesorhizobium mediterraneum TaxID=43617 RepID=UPI001785C292|nr:trypco2 family protein [Mesorhizobium mediterraneum]